MSENVRNRMANHARIIDEKIKHADLNKPFQSHFDEWWCEYNGRCSELYNEAGKEKSPFVNPQHAANWLNEQIDKLHKFLTSYSATN